VLARLSPRRRAFVAGVLLLVLAGVLVVAAPRALRVVRGDRAAPAQDSPGPVILVPGYGGGTGGLRVLAERIRAAGGRATVLELPGDGTGDLREQARALDRATSAELRSGAPSVDVIGYSAGGVTARLWAHDHDGTHKARRIITLGSPHRGAEVASAGQAFAPGVCPLACQQLVPGSAVLAGLGGQVPARPAWMSIWTARDETVTPPDSARLDGAVNVPLQSICPAARTGHGDLPTDPLVTGIVLQALGPAPLRAPAPSSACSLR
jgi:pimeloyl-ACP methyl ester carboxylesterase